MQVQRNLLIQQQQQQQVMHLQQQQQQQHSASQWPDENKTQNQDSQFELAENSNNSYNNSFNSNDEIMKRSTYQNRTSNQNQQSRQNDKSKMGRLANHQGGDRLAGMMTDKEKNWIINVQMLQLQIDDPYRYDYYYTAYINKKKQFSSRNPPNSNQQTATSLKNTSNNNNNPILGQQTISKHDPKNYRPLIFENSLGKVTMSNFHHPRALIDINQRSADSVNSSLNQTADNLETEEYEDKQKETKNIDHILLEIERMYSLLLSIDEIDHNILKTSEETRPILFQDKRAKVDKLALMLCNDHFPHYLIVDKGKRLLGKCVNTFNLVQNKLILGFLMQYIYIIAKNNIQLDEIYSHISYAIDTQKFNDLVDIVSQFVQLYSRHSNQVYQTIFNNKFALSFLLKFLSKSEMINQDDYENDVKTIWSCYLNLVLIGLNHLQPMSVKSDGTLIWNVSETYQLSFGALLDNFSINKDLWSKNERKLRELFMVVV